MVILPNGKNSFFDQNGDPLVGGRLWTYQPGLGVTTPKTTWFDNGMVGAHTNPIILDARGEAVIFWNGGYNVRLETAAGALIWTVENINTDPSAATLDAQLRADLADTANPAKGDAMLGVKQPYTGTKSRTQHEKNAETVTVTDFTGCDPTGVSDSTGAFNSALATGKKVLVPDGIYSVDDIFVIDNMDIEGASDGRTGHTILQVRTNNHAAFRHSASVDIQNVRIANLRIEAATGITGAKAYRQDDKTVYLAYADFICIETSLSLLLGYDGFFIFTNWSYCRDGYVGSLPVGQ